MKDEFEVLPVDHPGGGKSIIAWNLAIWEAGVDRRRPMRIEVSAALQEPTVAGLPQGADERPLTELHDRLPGLVKRRAKAKYALRITGEGVQVHVFYAPRKVGLVLKRDVQGTLESAIARAGKAVGLELEVTWHDDPEWSRLLGIFSAHDPKQYYADRALMIHMLKQRDAMAVQRPVAHRAFFDERPQCRDFLRDARKKLRFKSEGGPRKAPAGSPGALVVVLTRREPTIATWHIHPVVLQVKDLVARHRGTYDGWETELVERRDPVPLTPPGGNRFG